MSWLARLIRRLRTLTRRSAIEAAMDREMRAHIELETAERVQDQQVERALQEV